MKKSSLLLFLLLASFYSLAQEDMMELLEEQQRETNNEQSRDVEATFKTTRVVNGHSVELPAPGILQFLISHRFGNINQGARSLWGLDNAAIRLGLEYGIAQRLALEIGRSSLQKAYDLGLRYKLVNQKEDFKVPFTLVYHSSVTATTARIRTEDFPITFTNRLNYINQLLIASKLSSGFSLQLSPTLLHRNLTEFESDANTVYAIGVGTRTKINHWLSINLEYFLTNDYTKQSFYHDSFSVGFDLETGGHVFQLFFTNSSGSIPKQFIAESNLDWTKGDFLFGFNIARVFVIDSKK